MGNIVEMAGGDIYACSLERNLENVLAKFVPKNYFTSTWLLLFFCVVVGLQALKSMHSRMEATFEGSQILADRPRMSTATIDFDYLVSFPAINTWASEGISSRAQCCQQQNSQNSENFLRFSRFVLIKIFWGKFSEFSDFYIDHRRWSKRCTPLGVSILKKKTFEKLKHSITKLVTVS